MTADLVEFLNARLDEDEVAARDLLKPYAWGYSVFYEASQEELAHIERYRPARVLADVQAQRAILAEHERRAKLIVDGYYDDHADLVDLDWLVRLLAQPYADHADYRQDWRIDTADHG